MSATDNSLLPLEQEVLDGVQFGGKRNYGYGTTTVVDTQIIDLDEIDYSGIRNADAFILKLTTPYVLESSYPGAEDNNIPWWWTESREELGEREEKIVEQREVHRLTTVDHGQVVEYCGDRPVETAKNGIHRIGTHSKYGFGEFRIIPVERRETPQEA